jgi:hypothetical protein
MTGEQILEKLKERGSRWTLVYHDLPFPEYLLKHEQGAVIRVPMRTGDSLVRKGSIKRSTVTGSLPSGGKIIALVPA